MWRILFLPVLAAVLFADVGRDQKTLVPKRLKLIKQSRFVGSVNGASQALVGEDGRVAALFNGGAVVFYDTLRGEKLHEWNCGGGIHDGAFSGDGRYYATSHSNGTVKVFDIAQKKEIGEFNGTGLA